ncbi:MAG: low molecular weight phosphotyrosine protein phosphatase [Candidatus Sumerlaeaceae bacterium]|nr:low molecular weight phosphotyrosine protein phosphatase [Candidatus Sumerlaeaceae bacterium]
MSEAAPTQTVKVLFVCMGNICRSPAAQAVMEHLIAQRGLSDRIICDSAGTIGYHSGDRSDPRIRAAGTKRGYRFEHFARQIHKRDFVEFDYIVAMDDDNFHDIKRIQPNEARARVSLLMRHMENPSHDFVPDPYYGGPEGFELVLDLVEQACDALLDQIAGQHRLP